MSTTDAEDDIIIIDELNNLHIPATKVDVCANCGKEGRDLNTCNKCNDAKYCNAACKKKHRSKHKKKCERRVAELYDEQLFQQPPPVEDCPVCFLTLPLLHMGRRFKSCCGKEICSGCSHAVEMRDTEMKCPFCRSPAPDSDEENIKELKKRVEVGDANAMYSLGCFYHEAVYGLPQDHAKALELYRRAGELGNATAYNNIGNAYYQGRGVERDEKKAKHYYELAAMGGYAGARYNLGVFEGRAGNLDRALKHYMIAAGGGYSDSVKNMQQHYIDGDATKEDYSKALRAYQAYLDEIRSDQRDQAAVARNNKYY